LNVDIKLTLFGRQLLQILRVDYKFAFISVMIKVVFGIGTRTDFILVQQVDIFTVKRFVTEQSLVPLSFSIRGLVNFFNLQSRIVGWFNVIYLNRRYLGVLLDVGTCHRFQHFKCRCLLHFRLVVRVIFC
jgi:hypothetical protein